MHHISKRSDGFKEKKMLNANKIQLRFYIGLSTIRGENNSSIFLLPSKGSVQSDYISV